jgi:hypothetical protein
MGATRPSSVATQGAVVSVTRLRCRRGATFEGLLGVAALTALTPTPGTFGELQRGEEVASHISGSGRYSRRVKLVSRGQRLRKAVPQFASARAGRLAGRRTNARVCAFDGAVAVKVTTARRGSMSPSDATARCREANNAGRRSLRVPGERIHE